jgi:hypothetical protein
VSGAGPDSARAIPRALVQRWIDALSKPASDVPWGDIPADWFAARHLAYLRVLGAAGPDDDHPDAWTWYAFDDLARSEPDLCLDLVLATLMVCATPAETALLAAGPLEDVITRNGAEVIDRIEALARSVPRFRYALWAVRWQGTDGEAEGAEVWARVTAARAAGPAFRFSSPTLPPMA